MRDRIPRVAVCGVVLVAWCTTPASAATAERHDVALDPTQANGWQYEELNRYAAAEARQGVAVDAQFFYAIDNRAIAKYRKTTGERIAAWRDAEGGPFIHLNAGVVRDDRLYGAHSNYPGVPMLSSVATFDCAALAPLSSHSFGRSDGSLTWLDWREGAWFAGFAHYAGKGAEPGRDPSHSSIVRFDQNWQPLARWTYPPELVERFAGYSASGGGFGPDGFLFVTGHDATELYILRIPETGPEVLWLATISFPSEGQAFAWDHTEPGVIFSILRRTREVIVGRVTRS